jgi:hypothetical protein
MVFAGSQRALAASEEMGRILKEQESMEKKASTEKVIREMGRMAFMPDQEWIVDHGVG